MAIEASDITKLLHELGQNDPTCRALAAYAERHSIAALELAHEAIRILSAEKAHLRKVAEEALKLMPPAPIVVSAEALARTWPNGLPNQTKDPAP